MTKTLIDIPDDLLAAAMKVLGAKTKADAVRGALELVIRQQRQRDFVGWLAESGALADLNDPAVRKSMWE